MRTKLATLSALVLASACTELYPIEIERQDPPLEESEGVQWERILNKEGERFIFEDGALIRTETIEYCRCSQQPDAPNAFADIEYNQGEIIIERSGVTGENAHESRTRFLYKAQGLLESIASVSQEQTFEYDEAGHLISISREGVVERRALRDRRGNITEVYYGTRLWLSAAYDDENRVVSLEHDYASETFSYDSEGRVIEKIFVSPTGDRQAVRYEYNDAGLVSRSERDEFIHIFSYDDRGLMIRSDTFDRESDENIGAVLYEHDDAQRLIRTRRYRSQRLVSDISRAYVFDGDLVEVTITNELNPEVPIQREVWQQFERVQRRPQTPQIGVSSPQSQPDLAKSPFSGR